MRRLLLAGQLLAVCFSLTAGIVGAVIQADATALAVIIACLSVAASLVAAIAVWAYWLDARERQEREHERQQAKREADSRYTSTMDTVRVVAGGELPPLQASAKRGPFIPGPLLRPVTDPPLPRWHCLRQWLRCFLEGLAK